MREGGRKGGKEREGQAISTGTVQWNEHLMYTYSYSQAMVYMMYTQYTELTFNDFGGHVKDSSHSICECVLQLASSAKVTELQ